MPIVDMPGWIQEFPLPLVLSDASGATLWVNAAAHALTGYAPTELVAMRLEDLLDKTPATSLPPEHEGTCHSLMRQNGDTAAVRIITQHLAIDGQPAQLRILLDISGQLRFQKEQEALTRQLDRQKNTLRMILDHAPIGIWLQNGEGKLEFVNQAFCGAMGISEERFLAAPHYKELFDPEFVPTCLASDAKALASAGPSVTLQRLPFVDGRIHDLRVIKAVQRDVEGRPLSLVGLSLDISEELRQEKQLELWSLVAKTIRESIIITDAEQRILAINRAFTEQFGYSAEEVVGKTPAILRSGQHLPAYHEGIQRALDQEGHWEGELQERRKNGQVVTLWLSIVRHLDTEGRVSHYIATGSDISPLKAAQQHIQRLAYYDTLTQLPNRLLLEDHLKHAIARARRDHARLALLYIDLDNFKHINESYGHASGDLLLRAVARRLNRVPRDSDTLARLGGDDFMLLCECGGMSADVGHVVERIEAAFARPFSTPDRDFHLDASIGIALYPEDGATASELMRNADSALYRAKDSGKGRHRFYTQEMTERAYQRVTLENDLRNAIPDKRLELLYQPQTRLSDGAMVGLEALLRWRHPERGSVPPELFIPLAEGSRLILPIGEWVLREACAGFMRLKSQGHTLERIAVNVSPLQFQDEHLIERIREVLADTGCQPQWLELEVTESAVMSNPEVAIPALGKLRDEGVSIAIDDFGTGYSSLVQLKRLPVNRLKIDRAFVSGLPGDPEDLAITRAIIALGQAMKLSVLAEGVETTDQEQRLSREGCQEAQGYLFGQPMPLRQIEARLPRNPEAPG